MLGYRVRVSSELHAFLTAKSQAQGISRELLIERLVERAFPGEFVGMPKVPDELSVLDMTARPTGPNVLAIDGRMRQRIG